MTTSLWKSLEILATPDAVLAEWRQLTGSDFPHLGHFLRLTSRTASDYPCTRKRPCACRHEIILSHAEPSRAVCRCDDQSCRPIRLHPEDLRIHTLNIPAVVEALRNAFNLSPAPATLGEPRLSLFSVGVLPQTRISALFSPLSTAAQLVPALEAVFATGRHPFLLLLPTSAHLSDPIPSILARHYVTPIPLIEYLRLTPGPAFEPIADVGGAVARFHSFAAQCPHTAAVRFEGFAATLQSEIDRVSAFSGKMEQILAAKDQSLATARQAVTDLARGPDQFLQGLLAKMNRSDADLFIRWATLDTTLVPPAYPTPAGIARALGVSRQAVTAKLARFANRHPEAHEYGINVRSQASATTNFSELSPTERDRMGVDRTYSHTPRGG